jgi:hypothetical protein
VAKIARIPPANVSNDDRGKLQTLERDLKSVVFGQDKALEVLASAVKMARSGLGKGDKPIGSFLFSGPTGVGKTEAAKQLAYIMGIELIRFDMSEYMERHAVSRLIGAPPGYVGFDQGGLLTEAITKKPHCVLLLDEIEKAHPDIFNVLLQVMDHGTLTDNNGRKADFRNVIIIMTTNAGAETMNKAVIGFTNPRQAGDEMADIKRLFTPEFRNRLDATVSFKALDERSSCGWWTSSCCSWRQQLAEKKVEVTFTDTLRKHLAKKGFDPLMGARPMQRLIQDTIRRALADELLFGRLVRRWPLDGGHEGDHRREGRGVRRGATGYPAAAQEGRQGQARAGRDLQRVRPVDGRPARACRRASRQKSRPRAAFCYSFYSGSASTDGGWRPISCFSARNATFIGAVKAEMDGSQLRRPRVGLPFDQSDCAVVDVHIDLVAVPQRGCTTSQRHHTSLGVTQMLEFDQRELTDAKLLSRHALSAIRKLGLRDAPGTADRNDRAFAPTVLKGVLACINGAASAGQDDQGEHAE